MLLASLPLLATPSVSGKVLPFRDIVVSAPVQGVIQEMAIREGEIVAAGQPLARLRCRLEELELQRAKAHLERREFESKGSKKLYDSRIISEAHALETRIGLELAKTNYESAAEQVKLRTLCAPIDGLVVERMKDMGESVIPSQALFRVVDLRKVIVQGLFRAEDALRLRSGQKLKVRFPQLEAALREGEIIFVDAVADPASGCYRVKVLVENPDLRIKAGLKAELEGLATAAGGN